MNYVLHSDGISNEPQHCAYENVELCAGGLMRSGSLVSCCFEEVVINSSIVLERGVLGNVPELLLVQ